MDTVKIQRKKSDSPLLDVNQTVLSSVPGNQRTYTYDTVLLQL